MHVKIVLQRITSDTKNIYKRTITIIRCEFSKQTALKYSYRMLVLAIFQLLEKVKSLKDREKVCQDKEYSWSIVKNYNFN